MSEENSIEEEIVEDAEVEAPATTEEAPAEGTIPPNTITVNDLKTMVRVIQVGANRGAYNAEELEPVGVLYKNIVNFLAASGHITITPAEPLDPATGVDAPAPEMMPEETDGSTPGNTEAPASEDGNDTEES